MDAETTTAGLILDHVSAGYGETLIIEDISLALPPGRTLAVLGRNGVGKTTLLATVMGHTRLRAGNIRFAGRDISGLAPYRRARLGIGFVPQEREIFPSLTVEENLTVAEQPGQWSLAKIYDFFPSLAERRRNHGNQLSGGEQQMLAIGRALMGNPTLLLMDEPLEGLAPVIVDALLAGLDRLKREDELALLLVEQHARLALELAPETIVLDRGLIVFAGPSRELLDDPQRLTMLMGVGARSTSEGFQVRSGKSADGRLTETVQPADCLQRGMTNTGASVNPIIDYLVQSRDAVQAAIDDTAFTGAIRDIAELAANALSSGGKLLLAGNGGSAGDAQHLAGEMLSRLYYDRAPCAAIALTTDSSVLTAIGNDYGYDRIFERQILGLGCPGDVLIAISTSGRSPNILRAIGAAREKRLTVVGFTGRIGGEMAALCDLCLHAPSDSTPLIQQIHITAGHIICGLIEEQLFPRVAGAG